MSTSKQPRDWTRIALNVIVVGLMTVSIHGQVETITPRLGNLFAIVFAVCQDAAALLALNTGFRAPVGSSIRKWAWFAVLTASVTGGALNAYYVMAEPLGDAAGTMVKDSAGKAAMPALPVGFGLLIGLEPILLILVLSHLVGLAVEARRQDRQPASAGDRQAAQAATARTASSSRTGTASSHQSPNAGARPALPAGDRQPTGDHRQHHTPPRPSVDAAPGAADRKPARPAPSPEREPSPAGPQSPARATFTEPSPRPLHSVSAVPPSRPDWMTDAVIDAVVASALEAHAEGKPYGRPAAMAEHGLTNHKARTVLDHIEAHDLLRRSA